MKNLIKVTRIKEGRDFGKYQVDIDSENLHLIVTNNLLITDWFGANDNEFEDRGFPIHKVLEVVEEKISYTSL